MNQRQMELVVETKRNAVIYCGLLLAVLMIGTHVGNQIATYRAQQYVGTTIQVRDINNTNQTFDFYVENGSGTGAFIIPWSIRLEGTLYVPPHVKLKAKPFLGFKDGDPFYPAPMQTIVATNISNR